MNASAGPGPVLTQNHVPLVETQSGQRVPVGGTVFCVSTFLFWLLQRPDLPPKHGRLTRTGSSRRPPSSTEFWVHLGKAQKGGGPGRIPIRMTTPPQMAPREARRGKLVPDRHRSVEPGDGQNADQLLNRELHAEPARRHVGRRDTGQGGSSLGLRLLIPR